MKLICLTSRPLLQQNCFLFTLVLILYRGIRLCVVLTPNLAHREMVLFLVKFWIMKFRVFKKFPRNLKEISQQTSASGYDNILTCLDWAKLRAVSIFEFKNNINYCNTPYILQLPAVLWAKFTGRVFKTSITSKRGILYVLTKTEILLKLSALRSIRDVTRTRARLLTSDVVDGYGILIL